MILSACLCIATREYLTSSRENRLHSVYNDHDLSLLYISITFINFISNNLFLSVTFIFMSETAQEFIPYVN